MHYRRLDCVFFIRWGPAVCMCVNLCFRYFTHLLVSHFLSYHIYTCVFVFGMTLAFLSFFSCFLLHTHTHIYPEKEICFAIYWTADISFTCHTNKPNDRCEHVDEFYTGSHISLELCCNLLLAVRVSLPITNEIKIHNNSAKCISHTVEHIY